MKDWRLTGGVLAIIIFLLAHVWAMIRMPEELRGGVQSNLSKLGAEHEQILDEHERLLKEVHALGIQINMMQKKSDYLFEYIEPGINDSWREGRFNDKAGM